jgi:glycosyltransferase involved in cell wall biosynthesis
VPVAVLPTAKSLSAFSLKPQSDRLLGRPVIATTVGVLPENVLCPPRMRDELRTGWLVRPGDVGQLARALGAALALDVTGYEALGARARQFAEFVFSPQSVAEAFRAVYTSLLARDS